MTATTRTLSITMPLPSPVLSPNGRAHWRRVAAEKQRARTAAKMTAVDWLNRHDKPRPYFPADTTILVTAVASRRPRGTTQDADNLIASCKAYLDGWTDAQVWEDDRQVRWGSVTWTDKAVKGGRLVITITEVAA